MKKMSKLALLALLLATNSFAATDGTTGATSTGTSTITLTIPKLIKATSFSDFALGTYSGTGNLIGNDDLNIATNYGTAARTYRVTATGSGTASAFTVSDGGTNTIAYNAYFNDATGITGRVALATGTPLTAQTGAVKPLTTTTLNANLSIEFLQANLLAAEQAAYTGVVTLVFTPE